MIHPLPTAAAVALLLASAPASAFENTLHVVVNPERQWQCGDGFYANGGSDTYRHIEITIDGKPVGGFDLASPSDCSKVLGYFTDVPADQLIDVEITAGPYTFPASVRGADRNRVWTIFVFLDSGWGQLTTDYAPSRTVGTEPAQQTVVGLHPNLILVEVAPGRQWQCGADFYANGGSDQYRIAHLVVDGEALPDFDFASDEDCGRVESVTRQLADGDTSTVELTVGPYTMSAGLTARDWERTWVVYFFVDQIWGEVAEGSR